MKKEKEDLKDVLTQLVVAISYIDENLHPKWVSTQLEKIKKIK